MLATAPGRPIPEPDGHRWRKRAVLAAQILVVVGCGAFLALTLWNNWDDLRGQHADWRLEPAWMLVATAAMLAWYLAHAGAWWIIVAALGTRLPLRGGLAAWGWSLLGKYVPSSVPMIIGRCILAGRLGLPKRVGVASVLYEQALVLASGAAVSAVWLATADDLGSLHLPHREWLMLAVPILFLAVDPAIFGPIANRVLTRFGLEPLPQLLRRRVAVGVFALYTVSWLLLALSLEALIHSFVDAPGAGLWIIAAGYALGFTASILAFIAPSGLGVREAAFAAVLSTAMPTGLATAIALSTRVFQVAFEAAFIAGSAVIGRESGLVTPLRDPESATPEREDALAAA